MFVIVYLFPKGYEVNILEMLLPERFMAIRVEKKINSKIGKRAVRSKGCPGRIGCWI